MTNQGPLTSRLWLADAIKAPLLRRVADAARRAQEFGLRPRIVLFDYLETPTAQQLRAMAQELDLIVSVEAIERTLPGSHLRDRFRLLEKSKGIHGIFFPAQLTDGHRACLALHPQLSSLDVDQIQEGFSPQVQSFLQLASVHSWDPQGREAAITYSSNTLVVAERLATELSRLRMKVSLVPGSEGGDTISRSQLLWMCHGQPVSLPRLHLAPDMIVVDGGRAFEIPASLSTAQLRLLPFRLRGVCPSDRGLATLVNLNRIHRLLYRSLGPRHGKGSGFTVGRGRAHARG